MIDHRRLARSVALQVLYELDSTSHEADSIIDTYANMDLEADDARTLAYVALYDELLKETADTFPDTPHRLDSDNYKMMRRLVDSVNNQQTLLDKLIVQFAPEWPPEQIAIIDRSILRVAIFELIFDDTSFKVIINEAVEIAKMYGADSSPRFVNGVLGAVAENRTELQESYNDDSSVLGQET